jgi:hypothetical protein
MYVVGLTKLSILFQYDLPCKVDDFNVNANLVFRHNQH